MSSIAASAPARTLSGRWRPAAAVLAGVAVGLSWQPYGLWPLLLVGIPAFTLLVRRAHPRAAFGLGYLFGLGLLTLAVSWVSVLGWWVALLLIVVEAGFFGLLGVALSLSSRLRWWPLTAAACWVLVEFAYSHVPFGGFGWTRLAYAVVDTPLAGFLPLVGVAGVTFLTVLLAELVAYAILRTRSPGARRRGLLAVGAALALVLVGLAVGPSAAATEEDRETVQVGIVQGNVPGRGIEALGRMRSVTNNHLTETLDLTARWRLGQVAEPDFLLWPENSTDIDPLRDPQTFSTVQSAAALSGKPILVGAVTQGPGPGERQTTALWWDPAGRVLDTYHKQNLVPFGEWIPFRDQLLPLFPILKQVGAQSVAGTEPGLLTVPVGNRTLTVGDIICFELAYDNTVHEVLTGGAQVLVVQSNNATYGGTGQIEQQFAITRARAIEAQREIAVATTNSVSGFIDRSGRVVHRTEEFTAASLVVDMPLRSELTPAVRIGRWVDRGLALLGLGAVVLGGVAGRRSGARREKPDATAEVAAFPAPVGSAGRGRS
ncbi:MAG: apolipoprotein N-acyltransferase [Actinomycetes bacterium]